MRAAGRVARVALARVAVARGAGGPAGAGRTAQSRWRSLDSTGNVRLLSAEDLALEFPETPTAPARPDISDRPARETPPQTLIVGQSPTLDPPAVTDND